MFARVCMLSGAINHLETLAGEHLDARVVTHIHCLASANLFLHILHICVYDESSVGSLYIYSLLQQESKAGSFLFVPARANQGSPLLRGRPSFARAGTTPNVLPV